LGEVAPNGDGEGFLYFFTSPFGRGGAAWRRRGLPLLLPRPLGEVAPNGDGEGYTPERAENLLVFCLFCPVGKGAFRGEISPLGKLNNFASPHLYHMHYSPFSSTKCASHLSQNAHIHFVYFSQKAQK
jgi:hypothetical protein